MSSISAHDSIFWVFHPQGRILSTIMKVVIPFLMNVVAMIFIDQYCVCDSQRPVHQLCSTAGTF